MENDLKMFYNYIMDNNIEKKNKKEAFNAFLSRFRTPLVATTAVILTGALIVPPILGATTAGKNFFTSALNINAPALPDVRPSASAIVTVTTAPLPTIETVSTHEPVSKYATLQQGDKADSVIPLQERLMSLDFMDSDEPSTSYGATTAAAISRFQNVHHIVETGIADELTQTLLFSENAKSYSLSKSYKGNDILLLQKQLTDLGYYFEKQNGYCRQRNT